MIIPSLLLALAQGPVPYSTQADWESYPSGVSTGGAFADINGDGHLDLVVANGNDIYRQRVEVYYNDGSGGFPANPQWSSADLDYHGHLAVGDINGDGLTDVAVSVFLGPAGFGDYGHVKVYFNQGTQLESSPSWQSADSFYTFSCALGDADSDGDLDLAVAVGEPYYGQPRKNRVYYNHGGALETTPSWKADSADHAMDASWADVDGDGDLDLAFCTAGKQNRVYFQVNGVLQTAVGWSSTDNANPNGNSCAFADVDGDGDLDFCVSDNNQLSGGQGLFKIYRNLGSGLATTPYWSDYQGYVSAVAFGDLHLDGHPDLIGGSWWGGTDVYLNQAGNFPNSPDWHSNLNSVVEALFLGDLDGVGLQTAVAESHAAGNGRQLHYLDHAPVHAIQAVRVDGVLQPPSAWCANLEQGWVSVAATPTTTVEVDYQWSESLDLGVTNWDGSVGNLVFLRKPLVEVTVTPPTNQVFQPGDQVDFSGHWTSTTNRAESVFMAAAAFPPIGPMRLLDYRPLTLPPFGSHDEVYSVPIPNNLPPGFFGTTTVAVATVIDGVVVDRGEFQIDIH